MPQNSAQKTDQKTSKAGGKHIPRLYVPHIAAMGDSTKIDDATTHHHLIKVLRLGLGAEIRLFNENQGEWRAVIDAVDKKSLSYRILDVIQPAPPPPLYQITLYFG
ncbi:MAG: 16S rRNA (uracil(1498)-N(3))-methyltransferase, partial [Alphaproteobacteria bacterium]|nr:16S rRNA (uracil(1498)-N(3))-methyltransferase [Alphaproteobacteria bacterium]